jgi:hypothetical protein
VHLTSILSFTPVDRIIRTLREAGVDYVARKHLLVCSGFRELDLPFLYLGADDEAGANCTGGPAVDSWYRSPL